MQINVEYDSNNSGGYWWLDDDDWKALEKNGWHVHWVKDSPHKSLFGDDETDRWLGALATSACIDIDASNDEEAEDIAALKWENILNKSSYEEGCSCCGRPHSFYSSPKCSWR